MPNEPHGAMPFDRGKLKRCGATAKSTGKACLQFAMKNDRCYWHGGKSTGPRTAAGVESIRQLKTKHGRFSADQKTARTEARQLVEAFRQFAGQIEVLLSEATTGDGMGCI